MTNNPWAVDQMQQQPFQMSDQMMPQQQQQPQQEMPQQGMESAYPTMPNSYGLGTQQKKESPNVVGVSTSPWLWGGESNSR